MNKIKVDIWYGTPFANCKVHAVILDKENNGHANLLCTGKRLKYQGLSAGLDFDEVSCERCAKKLESGDYEHADKFFVKNAKDGMEKKQ